MRDSERRMKCSVCGDEMNRLTVWACVRCDLILEWPLWEHHLGLVMKAHRLGVGRLPRD